MGDMETLAGSQLRFRGMYSANSVVSGSVRYHIDLWSHAWDLKGLCDPEQGTQLLCASVVLSGIWGEIIYLMKYW